MKKLKTAALVLACLGACGQAAAMTQEEARKVEWYRIYRDAYEQGSNYRDCFGGHTDKACSALIAAIDAASASSSADEAARHMLSQKKLEVMTLRGQGMRERQDYKAADAALAEALEAMRVHYEDGKHAHVMVDNLNLLREVTLVKIDLEDWAGAGYYMQTARGIGDRLWENRENVGTEKERMERFENGVLDSEDFDTEVGKGLFRAALGHEGELLQQLKQQEYVAWMRAADWIVRNDGLGFNRIMDSRADVRYAQARIHQGIAASQLGNVDDARSLYADAMKWACRNPKQGATGLDKLAGEELAALCGRAAEADYLETDDFKRDMHVFAEEMVKHEIERYSNAAGLSEEIRQAIDAGLLPKDFGKPGSD